LIALLLVAYFGVLGLLALFGLYRLRLVFTALRASHAEPTSVLGDDAPRLVVQIPLYNESFVAERAIRCAAALRYPKDRLSIQVLDDSTDDTRVLTARLERELGVRVIRRDERRGFKAGALANGLLHSDAELVAIFDADFAPEPDFLERTVPRLLAEPRCALVQARWAHLNRNHSWLTRAQAIFLDGHFAIEHRARQAQRCFFNFNGTAGVWRRQAIIDAGGWSDDTLTEDLDLSYRTQLSGWTFAYLDQVRVPAELPERWPAFRSQQTRWVRGSVQTAKKLGSRVLSAKQVPLAVRFDAMIHLFNNFAYLLMALLAVLLPPAVVARAELGWRIPGGQLLLGALDLTMLASGTLAMIVFYVAAQRSLRRLPEIMFALCLGAGLSIQNTFAVLSGLSSRTGVFARTSKRGEVSRVRALAREPSRAPALVVLELLFAAYFVAAAIYSVEQRLYAPLPFLAMYGLGYAAIACGSLADHFSSSRWTISVTLRSSSSSSPDAPV
jgi:cellulose synthase/poly-beta-1,6-N-acetylglucosamine synthase-like glycosyltransferase